MDSFSTNYTVLFYCGLLILDFLSLFSARSWSRNSMEDDQVQLENICGFGQILSVLLLLLPIFVAYYGIIV